MKYPQCKHCGEPDCHYCEIAKQEKGMCDICGYPLDDVRWCENCEGKGIGH